MIRFQQDELDRLVESLRDQPGFITAAVVPPGSGDELIARLRERLGSLEIEVAARSERPVALGARAAALGQARGGHVFVLRLDEPGIFESEDEAVRFWSELNYQREALASGSARTFFLLNEDTERGLALIADDLWDWTTIFRIWSDEARRPQPSEDDLTILRNQWRRARRIGLPRGTLVKSYAVPLFLALPRSRDGEAFELWQQDLRGEEALAGLTLETSLSVARKMTSLARLEGAEPQREELTREALAVTKGAVAVLDRRDPLAPCRGLFHLPEGLLYFDGNSLGPLPRAVAPRIRQVVEGEWGDDLISSWNVHGWVDLGRRVAAKIAPLVGAQADEVAVADSTSVNLFKVLAAALELRPERRVIVAEREQFPTDLYMAQGLAALLGRGHELRLVATAELEDALGDDVAAVCLSHVQFKHGTLLDMPSYTAAAHAAGALAVWDLSHSAGALEVDLGGAGADFAVGCGYKFLNGGPGAPAYLYVARRHHDAARSPLAGWFGHEAPFAFDLDYRPAPGVDRFLCGTPPILSLAALDAALDVWSGIDLGEVRQKSTALGELLLELVEGTVDDPDLAVACPRDASRRGSQVSLSHPEGYAVVQALIDRGVVPDFRAPDVLRFGLTPLYLRYTDVWDGVQVLAEVLKTRAWDDPRYKRQQKVT